MPASGKLRAPSGAITNGSLGPFARLCKGHYLRIAAVGTARSEGLVSAPIEWCRFRPIADLDHDFSLLRCGPSNQSFVQFAAFCRLKRRSADKPALCRCSYCSRSIFPQLQQVFCCGAVIVVEAAIQSYLSRWVSNGTFTEPIIHTDRSELTISYL